MELLHTLNSAFYFASWCACFLPTHWTCISLNKKKLKGKGSMAALCFLSFSASVAAPQRDSMRKKGHPTVPWLCFLDCHHCGPWSNCVFCSLHGSYGSLSSLSFQYIEYACVCVCIHTHTHTYTHTHIPRIHLEYIYEYTLGYILVYEVCPEGILLCAVKNRDIYWRRCKLQETPYTGQWCLSPFHTRHLGTSHSFPNCH